MPIGLAVFLVFFVGGLGWVLFMGLRRMGWLGHTEHPTSSGFAAGLADLNAMLQPHHPPAEALAEAKEQDEEDEGEGDDELRNERPKP